MAKAKELKLMISTQFRFVEYVINVSTSIRISTEIKLRDGLMRNWLLLTRFYMRFRKKIDKTIQRYRLVDTNVLENCFKHISDEYVARSKSNGKPLNVILTDETEGRTKAQNRLMWMWYDAIGKKRGMTKEQVHDEMRAKYLLQLYRMYDPSYESVASEYLKDKIGLDEWQAMLNLGRMCSTTSSIASVEVMSKYLREIQIFAYINDIYIPIPEDLRWALND